MKDLTLFYEIKNMPRLDQYQIFKKRYSQETKDKTQQRRKI